MGSKPMAHVILNYVARYSPLHVHQKEPRPVVIASFGYENDFGKDFLKKAFADKPDLQDKMFAAMDTNKDGFLDLEEYKTGREKTRELMKDIFKKKE